MAEDRFDPGKALRDHDDVRREGGPRWGDRGSAGSRTGLGGRLYSNDDSLYDAQNVERISRGRIHHWNPVMVDRRIHRWLDR